MSSERRLHPVSVLFELGSILPRLLLPGIVLFVAGPAGNEGAAMLVIFGGFALLFAILVVLRHLRFTYRYEPDRLLIRSGIITRNVRSIPYVRIQNLDAAQNPLHRLFDVAVVHVQTGGGAEPEASLRVLPVAALNEMRARVLAAGGRVPPPPGAGAATAAVTAVSDGDAPTTSVSPPAAPHGSSGVGPSTTTATSPQAPDYEPARAPGAEHADAPERRLLLALDPADLILAGFIENRGMVLIAGALALLEQTGMIGRAIERLFQAENAALGDLASRWLGGGDVPILRGALYATAVLLGFLLFIRVLSTVWSVIRLYEFRLHRVGDELQTEYGMFTRVTASIPLRRVQTIVVRDGVIHRRFRRHAVIVETAGGETGAGTRTREPIAPILRSEQLAALLHQLHPGAQLDTLAWQRVHPRAFGRMLRAALPLPIVASLAAWFIIGAWALALFTILVTAAAIRAHRRARYLAWSLSGDAFAVRDGAFTRSTRIARFSRIQSVAVDRNPFDLRTGMARVRADTAGATGGSVVPYLPQDAADHLAHTLAARTAETAFTW